MPTSPLELLAELIIFCDIKSDVPLQKDVPRVNILGIPLLGSLRNKSGSVIRLLGPGGGAFPFPGGHLHQKRITGIKLDRFYLKLKIEK